ncbi:MAG: hypothetical protein R3B57_07260 [Phycisphaerales bacterium]
MSRRRSDILALVIAAIVLAPALARAQESGAPDEVVERYLRDHALDELLGAQLRERLATTEGAERERLAERLGTLYTRDLVAAATPQARRKAEERARALLDAMPEGKLFNLRVGLAITMYLPAEETIESWRLMLTGDEEADAAVATLRSVREVLDEVAILADREVIVLERRERTAEEIERAQVLEDLAEARRVRSLAHYYSGWSSYYIALEQHAPQDATAATASFAHLLDTPERRPTADRLPRRLLQFEHVARAAIGVALSYALDGHRDDSITWLEAIEDSGMIPPEAESQLSAAWIVVLSQGGEWRRLEERIKDLRQRRGPLDEGQARLLAVTTLRALDAGALASSDRTPVRDLASMAIDDLNAVASTAHVLDLASKFDNVPLGDSGFILLYAKGLRAYREARETHDRSGEDPGHPATNQTLTRQYDEAAAAFEHALAAPDAGKHPHEQESCRLRLGTSLFYAGELARAAEILEPLAKSDDPEVSDESAWMRVVALDLASRDGDKAAMAARDEAAAAYIRANPRSDRAAMLLMRLADVELLGDRQAAEVLAAVNPDSPLAAAARRHESRLRYRVFRSATPETREEAGAKFLAVAEPLLDEDLKTATTGQEPAAGEAAAALMVRARQVLDVVLSVDSIDVARAERAIHVIEALAETRSESLDDLHAELTFRRLQIAMRRDETDQVEALLATLDEEGGRFDDAAHRQLYAKAAEDWAAPPRHVEEARRVIRYGTRVIEQLRRTDPNLIGAATLGVMDTVASAGEYLFDTVGDTVTRDLALELDKRVLDAGRRPESVLRRTARLAETAGKSDTALDAWLTLMAGLEEGSPFWFEARYESIRLMLVLDPTRAREAMAQFRILHPGTLAPPWDERFADLEAKVKLAPDTGVQTPEGEGG